MSVHLLSIKRPTSAGSTTPLASAVPSSQPRDAGPNVILIRHSWVRTIGLPTASDPDTSHLSGERATRRAA